MVDGRKFSSYELEGAPTTDDYFLIVDPTTGRNKRVTIGQLLGISPQGVTALGSLPTTITALGNRSYSMLFPATQLSQISRRMRLRCTRTTAAPTTCASLNGTNQYFVKTSPAGMTFTDDFTVSAWVKPSSYAGASAVVASRYNGSSGWELIYEADGSVTLAGFNGGSGNFSYVRCYQSLPLNKWTHIALQLDMSAFTVTTTTSYIMLDGINVPAFVGRGGTNPVAITQAGNFEVGSANGGGLPFPGKIAQVALFNAKVAQATVRNYMSQTFAGTETSLVSAYSFASSTTDLNTTNANNLTAMNSASSSNADSPFAQDDTGVPTGSTDWAIVTNNLYSGGNTTLTVQVPEGCTIPTSGGLNAISYSGNAAPYGMPSSSDRWNVVYINRVGGGTTSNASYGSFMSNSYALLIPVGAWNVGWESGAYSATTTEVKFNLSPTSLVGLSQTDANGYAAPIVSPSAAVVSAYLHVRNFENLSAATTFILYSIGSTVGAGLSANVTRSQIYAEFAYL